eukprot:TRINITY_DN12228_c0_g1_i1.p1 TRINITY_DN12228_c0_g1~~TRINITY_DN12228_c0_g1_i1.p1  ORF type:complete len:395 (-),score=111.56 TRINITY_DN12228_c0_g1_i1:45-1229(-)
MSEFALYTHQENEPRAQKIKIAAAYANLPLSVNTNVEEAATLSPAGKVPLLQTPDGPVFETGSILRHVARLSESHPLYGSDPYQSSLVDSFVDFARNELELPAAAWLYPIWKFVEEDAEATTNAKQVLNDHLTNLNKYLETETYLVGNKVTIADIAVALTLSPLYTTVLGTVTRKPFGNVNRWIDTVLHQPIVLSIVGETEFLGEKGEPLVAQKVQPKQKAAKKPQPKRPDLGYMRKLPNGAFDLEEWKRKYANAADTREICPWFWENFDPTTYTLFVFNYNFPEDCTVGFKTSNLFSGYTQRLDGIKSVRNYCFASMNILKNSDDLYQIQGVWIWKGDKVPDEVREVDDTNYYTWSTPDTTDPSVRALVDDYFCWEGNFNGLGVFESGKNFAL